MLNGIRTLLFAVTLFLHFGLVQAEAMTAPPPETLTLWGVDIATFRGSFYDTTPSQRVARAKTALEALPIARDYVVDIIPALEGTYKGAWIRVNGSRVFGLLEDDATNEEPFEAFGQVVVGNLQHWLDLRHQQKQPKVFLTGLAYSLAGTLVFLFCVWGLIRTREWVLKKLEGTQSPKGVKPKMLVGGIYLMPYLVMLASGLLRIFMLALIGLFIYLWLVYVMRQFPYTVGIGHKLTDYIVDLFAGIGLSMLSAIPDLVMVGIIFWIASFFNDIVKNIFSRIESGRLRSHLFDPETAKATRRVCVVLVWLFAIVIAYPYIPGSDTEAFKGVSVFIGLIVSLGSAGIVSQLLGGLIVVYSRAFQPGEFVKIADYEGTVTAVGVLSTKIQTIQKEEITIPNAVLLAASSTNYSRLSRQDGLIVSTCVTIGYDTPWPQVHEVLLRAAERTGAVRAEPEPQVRQTALSDWYVEYRLLVFIDDPAARALVLSELHQHIQDSFSEAGLQIMSPHFIDQPADPVLPKAWVSLSSPAGETELPATEPGKPASD